MTLTTGTSAVPAAAPDWREERRRDRAQQAQITRDLEDAKARRRQEAADKRDARRANHASQRRQARSASRGRLAGWVSGHVTDLLFVPVIAVPAALAWTAMASYGQQVYGPPGRALPAFSEGAMWAFAAAVTITRHQDGKRRGEDPDAAPSPVWHLQLGAGVFAGFGAALNFAHGFAAGSAHGTAAAIVTGIVMAVVSVSGVTAHQIIKAGPRRTRTEKDAARIAREIRKRELKTRLAAVRDAKVQLDSQGSTRLVYLPSPGQDHAAEPPRTPAAPDSSTEAAPGPVPECAPGAPARRTRSRTPGTPGDRARTRTSGAPDSRTRPHPGAVTGESAEVHFAADLADGQVPSQRRIKAELHIGQDRATQIRAHLAAVAAASASPGPSPDTGDDLAAGATPDDAERTVA